MGGTFSAYLIYIALIICFLAICAILPARNRKKKDKKNLRHEPVCCGNVSVFFDDDGNVTIIPYVKNKYGIGKAIANPAFLSHPYKAETLGKLVRASMKLCENGSAGTDEELMSKLNYRNWKEFSEGKRNISVHYDEKFGVVMNSTGRAADGSFQFNSPTYEKVLNGSASDKEIGEALIALLPRCR